MGDLVHVGGAAGARFGALLRARRAERGRSQMSLAIDAGISTRHLSFLETGRASPSREMIARLADVLEIPAHARAVLFEAAGFAARATQEPPLSPEERAAIRRVLDATMRAFEGRPAIVVDRALRILRSNGAARALLARCVPEEQRERAGASLIALASREGIGACVENAGEMVAAIAAWVERGSALGEPTADAMLRELIAGARARPARAETRLVPARVRVGGRLAVLQPTITALWTPHDRTLDAWRVFAFLPVDAASEEALAAMIAPR